MTTTLALSKPYSYLTHPATIATASFLIPFVAHQPQLLVGTVVNMLLFNLAASNMPTKLLLPIACLPSLGALSHGLVLGQLTPVLRFVLPFIWAGNMVQVLTARKLAEKSYMVPAAALLKTLVIFSGTYLLFQLKVIPQALLVPMSFVQAATAIVGGILALLSQRYIKTS